MDRSSTSTLLGRMRALGLAERTPDPRDRRGVVVGLTADGHERVRATLDERGAAYLERIRGWSDADLAALTTLLRRLTTPPE